MSQQRLRPPPVGILRLTALCLSLGLPLLACDEGGGHSTTDGAHHSDALPTDTGAPEADTGAPEADTGAPREDAGPPPADAEPPPEDTGPPQPQACHLPADCPMGDCIDGQCAFDQPIKCFDDPDICPAPEICGGSAFQYYCALPCELDGTCARRVRPCTQPNHCPGEMSCHDGRCINSCATDLECPEDAFCANGQCIPVVPEQLGRQGPLPLAPDDRLHAGVAVLPLDYPMGVELAGYGGRPGPRNPYAFELGGSDRALERQDVRVIVLARGEHSVALVRVPLSWSTDHLITLTAAKLKALTVSEAHPEGLDFTGRIILFGTHSHSQPARFWNLAPGLGFGIFGHGLFSPALTERYSARFAETIHAALGDLSPARVGYTVQHDIDPQRRIHSDRRRSNAPNVDDRLMVLRVDDLEGNPRAAIANLAIHGTHMQETWVTGDVAAGIEVVATERLSTLAGRPVPVLFANGNAGDCSPRGDDIYREPWAKIQTVGHRLWPHFEAAWASIETSAEHPVEVVTRRVPISYDLLGYDRSVPEFRDRLGNAQLYGGFQCVMEDRIWGEDPPHEDGALGCLLNVMRVAPAPLQDTHKTLLSALRVGELIVTTLPGEPVSFLGQALSEQVSQSARAAGWQDPQVVQFGYSQDHHLYLLLEDDWFQGGYEAAQNMWGWRFGGYLVEQATALAEQLFTPEIEDNHNQIKGTWWPDLVDDRVEPTASADLGAILQEAPAEIARGQMFSVRWQGGHPEVDLPRFVLECEHEDLFAPCRRGDSPLPFDDSGFETQLIYRGDYAADHTWEARIELPFDLSLGRARLQIEGRALPEGAQGREAVAPYEVRSREIELRPAVLAVHDVQIAQGRLDVTFSYPDGPSNDAGGPLETLRPTGHWARLDTSWQDRTAPESLREWMMLFGPPLPLDAPVTLSLGDGGGHLLRAQPSAARRELVVYRDAEGQELRRSFEGVWASQITFEGLPEGAREVELADAHGNRALIALPAP